MQIAGWIAEITNAVIPAAICQFDMRQRLHSHSTILLCKPPVDARSDVKYFEDNRYNELSLVGKV
jgi:hypothetical protein